MVFARTVSKTVLIPVNPWLMLVVVVNLGLATQSAQAIQTSCEPIVCQNSFRQLVSDVHKPSDSKASNEFTVPECNNSSLKGDAALKIDGDETSLVFLTIGLDSNNTINIPTSAGKVKSKFSEQVVVPDNLASPITIKQIPHATFNQAKAICEVILSIASTRQKNGGKVKNVSVPSLLYLDVMMELQNRKASVMPPGEMPPAKARVKFQLQSGNNGIKQFVFLR